MARKGKKARRSDSKVYDRYFDADVPNAHLDLASWILSPILSSESADGTLSSQREAHGHSVREFVSISASEERLSEILAAIDIIGDLDSEKVFSLAHESMPEVTLSNGELLAALTIPGITYMNPLPQYPIEINLIRRFNPETFENFFYETTPRQFEEFSQAVKAYIDAKAQDPNAHITVPELPEGAIQIPLGTENPDLKLSQYVIGKETELYLRRQDLSNKINNVEDYYTAKERESQGVETEHSKVDRIFYALEEGPALVKEFDNPIYLQDFQPSKRFYERVYKKLTGDASPSIQPTAHFEQRRELSSTMRDQYAASDDIEIGLHRRTIAGLEEDGLVSRASTTLAGLGEFPGAEVLRRRQIVVGLGRTPAICISTRDSSQEKIAVADDTVERSFGLIFGMEEARVAEEARRIRESDADESRPYVSKVPTLAPAFGVAPDANVPSHEYAQRFSTEFMTNSTEAVSAQLFGTDTDTGDSPTFIVRQGESQGESNVADGRLRVGAVDVDPALREEEEPIIEFREEYLSEEEARDYHSLLLPPDDETIIARDAITIDRALQDTPIHHVETAPQRNRSGSRSVLYNALTAVTIASFGIVAGMIADGHSGSRQASQPVQNATASIMQQATAVSQPNKTLDDKIIATPVLRPASPVVNAPNMNERPTLDVFFAYNSAEAFVDTEGKLITREEVKRRVSEFVSKTGSSTIYVDGYTSMEGKESYNQALSVKRAKTIASLVCEANNAANVDVRGLGETDKFGATVTSEEAKGLENLTLVQRINHVKLREDRRVVMSTEPSAGDNKTGAQVYAGSCKGIRAAASGTPSRTQTINHVPQKKVDVQTDAQEGPLKYGSLEQRTYNALTSLTPQDRALVSSLLSDPNESLEEVSSFLESYLSSVYSVTVGEADIAALAKVYKQPVQK
ncbi:OmpA family protein [Candidatus Woesearchaeota archaeon]|nr:OmpA family protein [Candidatus Woesearchaeota archaeon]